MSSESGSDADPTADGDTPEAIMKATYAALCTHGFADLTMQDIADESDRSKAALHYHFDTKEDLLLAFLDHLYDAFTDEYSEIDGDDAIERLVTFVDAILCRTDVEGDEAFQTALLELRAQAPFDDQYREKLVRFDAFVRDRVEDVVADGIAGGTVREDVDPEDTAAFVATLIDGVNARRVTVGETEGGTRRTFVAFVREHLVAPDADVVIPEADADAADERGADAADERGADAADESEEGQS